MSEEKDPLRASGPLPGRVLPGVRSRWELRTRSDTGRVLTKEDQWATFGRQKTKRKRDPVGKEGSPLDTTFYSQGVFFPGPPTAGPRRETEYKGPKSQPRNGS